MTPYEKTDNVIVHVKLKIKLGPAGKSGVKIRRNADSKMFVFVSGTVRSGKSEWAERAAMALSPSGPRVYLATARVLDDEMRRRVELHQTARQGRGFSTLERPRGLDDVLPSLPQNATVLLECLGNWTANELFGEDGDIADAERTIKKIHRTALNLRDQSANLLIVSNDLFCDGVRYDAGTEAYLRALGAFHVFLVGEADAAVECVSGLARMAKGQMPWTDAPIERARRA